MWFFVCGGETTRPEGGETNPSKYWRREGDTHKTQLHQQPFCQQQEDRPRRQHWGPMKRQLRRSKQPLQRLKLRLLRALPTPMPRGFSRPRRNPWTQCAVLLCSQDKQHCYQPRPRVSHVHDDSAARPQNPDRDHLLLQPDVSFPRKCKSRGAPDRPSS